MNILKLLNNKGTTLYPALFGQISQPDIGHADALEEYAHLFDQSGTMQKSSLSAARRSKVNVVSAFSR